MNRKVILGLLVAALVAGLGWWWWRRRQNPVMALPPVAATVTTPGGSFLSASPSMTSTFFSSIAQIPTVKTGIWV